MRTTLFLLQLLGFLLGPAIGLAQERSPLQPLLQPFVDKHQLAGAIGVVVNRDKILARESVGFADIASKKAMPLDGMFWIASQSKPMTAVAVMMLVDEGTIALDDPVEKHLPEFRGQMLQVEKDNDHVLLTKPGHPITIREVLSHMSGLPFRSAIEEPTLDALPLAVAVKSYAMTPLQTEPGTAYQYSNAGIGTAARILEVNSGMPYEIFMQERLFDPLGMTDTTFWPSEEQENRVVTAYRPNETKDNLAPFTTAQLSYPLSQTCGRFPMPAGGLFSTAKDTAAFCRMMLNQGEVDGVRYLSNAAFKELTTRQTPDGVKQSYGLGFSVGGDSFGHGGALATGMEIHPGKNIATVWLLQHGGFPGEGGRAQGVFKNWAHKTYAER